MHHFGEDSTEVIPTADGFRVIFRNKNTGGQIVMDVPASGVLGDVNRAVDHSQVEDVARDIAHILRARFA